MKRFVLIIIIISLAFVACSTGSKSPLKMQNANVGEKVYKEVSVNNETIMDNSALITNQILTRFVVNTSSTPKITAIITHT